MSGKSPSRSAPQDRQECLSHRPLAGRRIVVTRAPEQAGELARQLEDLGAEVILLPTVGFAGPEDTSPLDLAIRSLGEFDWVLLTSQNAVRFFVERCSALGVDCGRMGGRPRIAAVGPATAAAAAQAGLRVEHTASGAAGYRGEVLAAELKDRISGKRILLPRSNRARPDLPLALRAAGAEVAEVVAYRTAPPGETRVSVPPAAPRAGGAKEQLASAEVDAITFASPSAFASLLQEMGADTLRELSDRTVLAAIGPVTARAIRDAGFAVEVEAADSTAAGLAAALAGYYERRSASPHPEPGRKG